MSNEFHITTSKGWWLFEAKVTGVNNLDFIPSKSFYGFTEGIALKKARKWCKRYEKSYKTIKQHRYTT